MKKRCTVFLLSLFSLPIVAQQFIRYNHVGYAPHHEKRIVIMSNDNCKDMPWEITDVKNTVILTGKAGLSITGKGTHTSHNYNHEVDFSSLQTEGVYRFTLNGSTNITFNIKQNPYAFIPSDILRYLRVQRSGSASCLDHLPSHYGDSSCAIMIKGTKDNDSWKANPRTSKVNMLGGWYDAGDYLKFTLTIAYTTHQLLHAYTINPSLFQEKKYSTSTYNDLLDEAKVGLDYLCRTMPNDSTFIIQVGGAEDHKQGDRLANEDKLDGKRAAYSAFSPTQMGYTAAALALGAQVFDSIQNPQLYQRYKNEALKIFNKAYQTQHPPAWIKDGWESFYGDERADDNMQLAALELYKLTKNKWYLEKAKEFAHKAQAAYWYSWGDANMLAHNRLFPYYNAAGTFLAEDLSHFKKYAVEEGNIWHVPHEYTWASLYSLMGVANHALLYDRNTKKTKYSELAQYVIDYTLGKNNWGITMVCSKQIPQSVKNIYAQTYKLQPNLFATGAVAEGPGDRATHEELKQYFNIPATNSFEAFNTDKVVFYDFNTNFQTMETTIVGLSDALLLFTLSSTE